MDRLRQRARLLPVAALAMAAVLLQHPANAQEQTQPPGSAPPPQAAPPPSNPTASGDSTAPSSAPAAAEPADHIQEIVVTATRHEEALSKVPESVSAFTQTQMDQRGIKDIVDVVRYIPGVQVDATGTGTNQISIRGISSSGGSGTTGIYIDDTPIQIHALGFNPDDTLPKTFDLDRVEVLRGPQGTLFGAGSEGGTVRYILTQPSLNRSSVYARSEVATTQGGAPSYEAGVAGGAPIIDGTLGVRASFWYRRDGGWIDRIDPFTLQTVDANANYDDTYVARLAAKWAVTPEVTVSPSVLYQDRYRNDISVFWPIDTGANGQVVTSNPGQHRFLNADPNQRTEPDRYWLPALKIEADVLNGASLISNTSYYDRHDTSGYEGTLYNLGYYQTVGTRGGPCPNPSYPSPCAANPIGTLSYVNDNYYPLITSSGLRLPAGLQNYRSPATVVNEQKTFTQEIRLQSNDPNARLTWTTGVFYQFTRQLSLEEIYDPMVDTLFNTLFGTTATGPNGFGASCLQNIDPVSGQPGYCPLVQGGYSYYNYNTGHDRQEALFGEINFKIIDQLKLIAGARIAQTAFNFTHYADGTQNGGPSINSGNQEEKPFTPKVGLEYQIDRNDMVYFTYAKGFRTGGDNAPIPSLLCPSTFSTLGLPVSQGSNSPATYKSDTVKSWEIGAKNRLFDSLSIASSLYYINWDNIQQFVYLPGCGFQFTTNVGNAISKGGDVQVDWTATRSLSFQASAGFTDARYAKDAILPGAVTIGGVAPAPIAKAGDAVIGDAGVAPPPWTYAVGVLYNFVAFDLPSYARLDYEHQSRSHTLTAAQDPRVSPTIYDPYAYTPPATTFVTARVGTRFKGWDVSAFVDNLFDAHPLLPPGGPNSHTDADPSASPFAGAPNPQGVLLRYYTFRPRTIGLTAIYRM